LKRPIRISILGGGIGGLSTAFFLGAEEGVEVTLFEREPRHDAHSSGRSAEILRTAIDQPFTADLGLRTAHLLRHPEEIGLKVHAPLIDTRGLYVITGEDDPAWLESHQAVGAAVGAAVEVSRAQLREAAPHFHASGPRIFHLPSGGHINAGHLMRSLARGAAARGVELRRSAGPAQPVVEEGRVTAVRCGAALFPCDRLVIAAGAWTTALAADLGVQLPLRTTRRHMWVATSAQPERAASAPVVWDDTAGFYARPDDATAGPTTWAFSHTDIDEWTPGTSESSPSGPMYEVDSQTRAAAFEAAHRYLPGEPLQEVHAWRGFRDLAAEDHPILGPDKTIEGLFWCAGLGGHGMTISLATGEHTALAVFRGTVSGTIP